MEFLSVIAAAAVAWVFGAVWYGIIGKQWMEASGLTEDSIDRKNPAPYIVSFLCTVLVAGMMRHILAGTGPHTGFSGLLTGFGLGLFVVAPWIATNVMFAQRARSLIWMDGIYPTVGCALMGLILTLL